MDSPTVVAILAVIGWVSLAVFALLSWAGLTMIWPDEDNGWRCRTLWVVFALTMTSFPVATLCVILGTAL